jgi:signal transduction histidine kinase
MISGQSVQERLLGHRARRLLDRLRSATALPGCSERVVQTVTTFLLIGVVGVLDYVTGPDFSFAIFYLLPVAFGAWSLGKQTGILACLAGAMTWLGVDLMSDASHSHWSVPYWNALVRLGFFLIVVSLLSALKRLTVTMEENVRHKTALLTAEIREREAVQRQLIESKEAEQRRLARELHDGLCQFLTGTAFKAKSLQASLAGEGNRNGADAGDLVSLLNEAVAQVNRMAKGFDPLELESGNLTSALEQLAGQSERLFGVACVLQSDGPPVRLDSDALLHLYRIAQESINNAIRHGRAGQISLSVRSADEGVSLTIEDDGIGFAPEQRLTWGMGLRTMQYRANAIGGRLDIRSCSGQGSRVSCEVPGQHSISANGKRSAAVSSNPADQACDLRV